MSRRLFVTALSLSLAAALAGTLAACGTPPADLDLGLRHPSAEGRFVVDLVPPAQGPAVGQIHAWTVRVAAADGQPVSGARITVDGGMPQHGHGLPTRPRVTAEPSPGTYLVEGMKFSMTGWWEMRFDIDAGGARDRAQFNLVLDESGLKR